MEKMDGILSNKKQFILFLLQTVYALWKKKHQSFANGFNSWWKLNPKVFEHENSENHLYRLQKRKILENGLKLQKQSTMNSKWCLTKKKNKWHDILSCLFLDVILFLVRQWGKILSVKYHRLLQAIWSFLILTYILGAVWEEHQPLCWQTVLLI